MATSYTERTKIGRTELKSPTATGGDGNTWTNPANAYSSNNVYTTRLDDSSSQQVQSYSSFGFVIPTGAIIAGIEVKIEAKRTATGTLKVNVYNTNATAYTAKTTDALTTSDVVYTVGGSTDLWSLATWTVSDFTDANFKMRIGTDGSNDSETLSVDHIQIRIHYTAYTERTRPSATSYTERIKP